MTLRFGSRSYGSCASYKRDPKKFAYILFSTFHQVDILRMLRDWDHLFIDSSYWMCLCCVIFVIALSNFPSTLTVLLGSSPATRAVENVSSLKAAARLSAMPVPLLVFRIRMPSASNVEKDGLVVTVGVKFTATRYWSRSVWRLSVILHIGKEAHIQLLLVQCALATSIRQLPSS